MKSILFLAIGAAALMMIGCNKDSQPETPNSLINTHWYMFNEDISPDKTRITNESMLKFFVADIRLTNQKIVNIPNEQPTITNDTIYGTYTYKMPKVDVVFDTVISGTFKGEVDVNVMSFIIAGDTLKFTQM